MISPFFKQVFPFVITLLMTWGWASFSANIPPNSQNSVDTQTWNIHQAALTIDSHIDWPIHQYSKPDFNPGISHETGKPDSGQWDLPRMEAGGLDGVFMCDLFQSNY
jgi:membrane dipeptidase